MIDTTPRQMASSGLQSFSGFRYRRPLYPEGLPSSTGDESLGLRGHADDITTSEEKP